MVCVFAQINIKVKSRSVLETVPFEKITDPVPFFFLMLHMVKTIIAYNSH